jgi:hypothetical protein
MRFPCAIFDTTLGVIHLIPGQSERETIDADSREFGLPLMPTNANETLESAIAPSSDGFPMRLQDGDTVGSCSTDGNSDKTVNTKSANPDADFLSNENYCLSKPVDVPNLFPKQPGDSQVTPRYHDSKVISGSQNAGVGHINIAFNSAAMPTRSPQSPQYASPIVLSVAHRDVGTDIFPMDETPGPHVLPTEADMSTSQLQLTDPVLGAIPPGKSEVVLPNVRLDNRNTNAIVPLDVVSNSVRSSPLSIIYPGHVDVTSGEMFISTNAVSDAAPPGKSEVELPKVLLDDRNADVIVPNSPLNCSAPAPTVNLPFLPTTTSRFESNKELAMLDAQDSPIHSASILLPEASNFVAPSVSQNGNANCISVVLLRHDDQPVGFLEPQQSTAKDISEPSDIQVTDLSRPMDVPQAMNKSQIVGVPQPAVPLRPHECPTDVPRTTQDICQRMEMPQYLDVDVDMLSDFDGSAGDDENQSGDSDQILNSSTYHQLITQPVS